jgi:hypothetical protein
MYVIMSVAKSTKGGVSMTRIEAIKEAIAALPDDDYAQLRQWFSERDWRKWDNQIKRDSAAGKMEFLVREAFDEKGKGRLRDL